MLDQQEVSIIDPNATLNKQLDIWKNTTATGKVQKEMIERAKKGIISESKNNLPIIRQKIDPAGFSEFARELATPENTSTILDSMLTENVLFTQDEKVLENYQMGMDKIIFELKFLDKKDNELEEIALKIVNALKKPKMLQSKSRKFLIELLGYTGSKRFNYFGGENQNAWDRRDGKYVPKEFDFNKIPTTQGEKDLLKKFVETKAPYNEAIKILNAVKSYRVMHPSSPESKIVQGRRDCYVTSWSFSNFCRANFKIDAGVGTYSSGKGYPGGYDSDFSHTVNVVFGARDGGKWKSVYTKGIAIDWTHYQFPEDRDKPYPYVYSVGDRFKIPITFVN